MCGDTASSIIGRQQRQQGRPPRVSWRQTGGELAGRYVSSKPRSNGLDRISELRWNFQGPANFPKAMTEALKSFDRHIAFNCIASNCLRRRVSLALLFHLLFPPSPLFKFAGPVRNWSRTFTCMYVRTGSEARSETLGSSSISGKLQDKLQDFRSSVRPSSTNISLNVELIVLQTM